MVVHSLQAQEGEPALEIEEVVVTGSRIRRHPIDEPAPITVLNRNDLNETGLTNLGDMLQNLPISGSAPNSQFNVPGNSGFPQDGSGIGAGSVQFSLRNLEAKRTLILVDGRRWIAGASASGVPSTVDLNSLPDNIIQRIEILQDGASAVYGSDAIGGVVNIITDHDFQGVKFDAQTGAYLDMGDGESTAVALKWGFGNQASHVVLSASWRDERGIETSDRKRSAFPNPDATSCDVPGTLCSSFTPQGRFVFGPRFADGASVTLNDGALNDGGANIPRFDPMNPSSADFHSFTSADRFNYNGPTFNYLRTPNERTNFVIKARHLLAPMGELFSTLSYTNRSSATKAAPEPLCLGNGCGNPINNNFIVSALNPFNPFAVDLSVADGTLEFFGRRPLESGSRLFFQETDTFFGTLGIEGDFDWRGQSWHWEAYVSHGENSGFQHKYNSHNSAKLQVAMGDPEICAATPGCVPFNFFGGQGPYDEGSITQPMLDYVTYTQRDASEQTLTNIAVNLAGDLFSLPTGDAHFATGIEYRDHEGWFLPDPIAERGETAGIPAGRTDGAFDVWEIYGEASLPLVNRSATYWEINLAARYSDYSTSGDEATYKLSTLFRPIAQVSLRASTSSGFRAPGVGELYGGAAREDFTFLDPCSDVLGQFAALGGGRDSPQPQHIIDNCSHLGVPTSFVQTNPQLSALSAGNSQLDAETSESHALGLVWRNSFDSTWIAEITASLDYYENEIKNAVQGQAPAEVLLACVDTLEPRYCKLTPRTSNGALDVINNRLQNIGRIKAAGLDLHLNYQSPFWRLGQIGLGWNASLLMDYKQHSVKVDGTETVVERAGTHTNETFQRAFPELRWVATIDWRRANFSGVLSFRWTGEMQVDNGQRLDSALFTDLRLSYSPGFFSDAWQFSLGFNNILDEDPPLCFPCGVIGMSQVVHDLPGRVGYLRMRYQR